MLNEWWHSAIFYEIYIRSFCDGNEDGIGDFDYGHLACQGQVIFYTRETKSERIFVALNFGNEEVELSSFEPSPPLHERSGYFPVDEN